MCDSTNAERPGFTMSERTAGHVFDNLFNEYKSARIIIATFASNVDRVQQILSLIHILEAKNILIERNLRLVAHVVKKYQGTDVEPVSYTHLDVYKRQPITRISIPTSFSTRAGLI